MAGQGPPPVVEDDDLEVVIPPSTATAGQPPPQALPMPTLLQPPPGPGTGQGNTTDPNDPRMPQGLAARAGRFGLSLIPPAVEIGASMLGSRIPGGGVIRRSIGAGLGASAGRVANTPLVGPPSVEDVIGAGVGGAFGEVAGTAAMKLATGPFAARVTARGRQLVDDLAGQVLPSQVARSPILEWAENLATGPLGQEIMEGAEDRQMQAIMNRLGRTLEDLSTATPAAKPQAGGKYLQQRARELTEEARQAHSALYGTLWKNTEARGITSLDARTLFGRGAELEQQLGPTAMASGAAGPSGAALRGLRETAEEAATPPPFGAGSQAAVGEKIDTLRGALSGLSEADPRHAALLKDLQYYTTEVLSPEQLASGQLAPQHVHALRSMYARGARLLKDNPERAVAFGHFSQLAKAADDVLKQLPEDLYRGYRQAGEKWAEFTNTYRRGALRDLARNEPETFLDQLVKPHDVEGVEAVKKVLPAEDFAKVQRAFAERLLNDGSDGVVSPGVLRARLGSGEQGYGPEVIEAMFPGGKHNGLYQFQRILDDTVGRRKAGTGKVYIQLATASAISGVATGVFTGSPGAGLASGGVILLTPAILARVLTSPLGKKYLTTGLAASHRGKIDEAAHATAQLAAWLVREKIIDPHRPATTPGPAQPTLSPAATSGRGAGPGPRGGSLPQPPPPPSLDEVVVPPSR